jgi:hypothetical protein
MFPALLMYRVPVAVAPGCHVAEEEKVAVVSAVGLPPDVFAKPRSRLADANIVPLEV